MSQIAEANPRRQEARGGTEFSDSAPSESVGSPIPEASDSRLVFSPVGERTVYEDALLRHPELVAQIEADIADPSRGVRSETWEAMRPRVR